MKKCNACGATFDSGKFCGKCGSPMEEIQVEKEKILVEEPPIEKEPPVDLPQPEENPEDKPKEMPKEMPEEQKSPKSKKRFGAGKIAALVLVLLLVGFIGFSAYYLNQSQLSVRVSSNFDEEAFKTSLFNESFDGETLDLVLPEKGINYYIQEALETYEVPTLPFGTELSDVFYKEGKIYVQLDGSFVHTSLVTSLSAVVTEGKILLEPEKVALGKWSIPLPKGILNQAMTFPIEVQLPEYLMVKELELDEEIQGELILEAAYFDTLIQDAFETIDTELLYYVQNTDSNFHKIYSMHEYALSGDQEMMQTFRHDIIRDEDYFIDFLAIMPRDEMVQMLEQVRVDSIHLEADAFDDLINRRDATAYELADLMETYRMERVTKAGLGLIDGFYDYLDAENVPAHVISYEGKPYAPTLSQFIYAKDILEEVDGSIPSSYAYDLFYDGYYLLAGVQTEEGYYTVDQWGDVTQTTKEAAYDTFGFKASSTLEEGLLLPRGHADRTNIAEVVSDYVGSDNSMYIRYLKSDSNWAVLIASPGDYPQTINQYVLSKKNNIWTVVGDYGETYTLTDSIGMDLISQGFNVSLLPPFEVSDYYSWYLYYSDIDQIENHLAGKGMVSYSDEASYISRIDDVLATIIGGKRFIFIFEDSSATQYKELIEVKTGETFSTYAYKLNSEYMGPIPTYVFIQD